MADARKLYFDDHSDDFHGKKKDPNEVMVHFRSSNNLVIEMATLFHFPWKY